MAGCPVHREAGRPAGRFRLRQGRVLSLLPHHGAVAQLVAHLVRNEGVRGSSPLSSTPGQRPFPGNGGGPLTSVQQVAELCGRLTVKGNTPLGLPAEPGDGEVIFSTVLTTEGGDDSMPDGDGTPPGART